MDKFMAKAKVDKNIYVHNDLENAAFYFAKRVKKRAEDGDRDGIGHDDGVSHHARVHSSLSAPASCTVTVSVPKYCGVLDAKNSRRTVAQYANTQRLFGT